MAWQPQEEPLRQLAGFLRDSLSGHDLTAQKNATLVGYSLIYICSAAEQNLARGVQAADTSFVISRCSLERRHRQTT